ncbi:hypothetical protein [Aestuariibius sp. HNIBRBA575]|uniref:hypothetical protein n=1 Tax=Aestuariibius sp. HNIBRBA575 TaxID=3233343 RepID=UPI0034A5CE56
MKLLLAVISFFIAGTSVQAATLEEFAAILEANSWGWSVVENGCVEQYRVFSFNRDFTKMQSFISEGNVTIDYRVLGHSHNSITMQIIGEDRLDDDGAPVVWQLRFAGEGMICWRRTDWLLFDCTRPLLRCDTTPPAS